MQSSVSVNEGDRLRLACTVQGVKGLLSVTWQHKASSTATAAFTRVISLSQEGVMEKAEEFMSRKIRATRPAADSFTLEFDEVTLADSGVYQCTVSEWKTDKTKTNSQSQTATVTVDPTGRTCHRLSVWLKLCTTNLHIDTTGSSFLLSYHIKSYIRVSSPWLV